MLKKLVNLDIWIFALKICMNIKSIKYLNFRVKNQIQNYGRKKSNISSMLLEFMDKKNFHWFFNNFNFCKNKLREVLKIKIDEIKNHIQNYGRKKSNISSILLEFEFKNKKLILAPVCLAKWNIFIDFLTIWILAKTNYERFWK